MGYSDSQIYRQTKWSMTLGLKIGDPRVIVLFLALALFCHLIDGDFRNHVAGLLDYEVQTCDDDL